MHPVAQIARAACLSLAAAFISPDASAMIFYSSGDLTFNSTAPTGALADSGWQWQGRWGSVTGTPVAPNYFLTAKHVGGSVGDALRITDPVTGIVTTYTTVEKFTQPNLDLNLWRVDTAFSSWAPLYTGSAEIGLDAVVFGRGAARGTPVTVSGLGEDPLRGWNWMSGGGTLRWGENTVSGVETLPEYGQLLSATFDADSGGPNEAMLAGGDSSGGFFVRDPADHQWKLAGINLGAELQFRYSADGTTFNAAIFDAGGLYYDLEGTGTYTLIPDEATDQPAAFYVTRISANAGWIQSITAVPEPAELAAASAGVLALFALGRRWRRQGCIKLMAGRR